MFPNRSALTMLRLSYVVPLLLCLFALPVFAAVSDEDALNAMETTQAGFRAIHAKVAPAVVSITSQMTEDDQSSNNPFDFFFGTPPQSTRRTVRASGSGVIIRKDGIILTNSHVVENTTKLTVQLSGSETPLPAEVVQADPRTDLAIVKITEKGEHTYPVATLGDAKSVHVGDWAIAFGSPFRLASTMTVGVISATGRDLYSPDDQNHFSDLLQTDASINPGNSGGPLCNIHGEVIGINFMIYSPGSSAGSVGIGFAIPIDDYTRHIIDTLETGHAIERGRLGIVVKNLDQAMRDHYNVPNGGILVDSVLPDSAADKAGVKAEDVITEFNGVKITGVDQFVQLVEQTTPGTTVPLMIIRDGKERRLSVTVGAVPTGEQHASLTESKVGLAVTTITPEIAAQLRLGTISGVLVTNVAEGSPAEDAGFERGDIILRVDAENVRTEDEFWTALSKEMAVAKHGVLLRVQRGDAGTTLSLPIIEDQDNNKSNNDNGVQTKP